MLNKLLAQIRDYDMIAPGDSVVCAVSGGADSMALLFAMYLLQNKLHIRLSAAHFNHNLRGEESQRDEAFVRQFCESYGIPLHVGSGIITPGKKGLEAAAREARYRFFATLPGKIATAHTCDDNAETILMHLVRGTGLKGLGGISPVSGQLIRPMLTCSRQDVEDFLAEYSIRHIEDSSNSTDDFLRNRMRHHVLPLLKAENPRLAQNLSAMAMGLRQDEAVLEGLSAQADTVTALRQLPPALRTRALVRLLKGFGIPEPEKRHISLAESLVFSDNPSASANFPGGITLIRVYDRLDILPADLGSWSMTVSPAQALENDVLTFTVCPAGRVYLRTRQPGDAIRLPGGTRSLKKLLIDRKIPAHLRDTLPILCDDLGILAVATIGVNQNRKADSLPAVTIRLSRQSS